VDAVGAKTDISLRLRTPTGRHELFWRFIENNVNRLSGSDIEAREQQILASNIVAVVGVQVEAVLEHANRSLAVA
jgi:hypothetical protein